MNPRDEYTQEDNDLKEYNNPKDTGTQENNEPKEHT